MSNLEILEPRAVPLGGLRAMTVLRTLPQRHRSFIGAWCFIDHYGPDRVTMDVPAHPHTGLQTASWLFSGQIEHRDSAGHHAMVKPGELNLMTAGWGISHSERSTPDTAVLHGAQLWIALPEASRGVAPDFTHYAPPVLAGGGWTAQVFLGSLLGSTSPIATFSALVGAEIRLDAHSILEVPVDPGFEHGILVDQGTVTVRDAAVDAHHMAYLPPGRGVVRLYSGSEPVRLLLLGGEPLGERIVMWWNFIGSSHEDIARARADWQARIRQADPQDPSANRFDLPYGEPEPPLPAPPLPNVRLLPRG